MLESHFFAFLFWQRAYHRTSPLQGTRTNFFNAIAKNWFRTHLATWPLSYGLASLANKKAKK
jgi:hypothetical protein